MAKGRKSKAGHKADERPGRQLTVPPAEVPAIVEDEAAVLVDARIPPMPPTLPDGALEAWNIVCSSLANLGEADLGDVEICVGALHDYRRFSLLLDQMGYVREYEDPDSGALLAIVPDAVVKLERMRHNAANRYRYHADQLGLSRMSRARLGLLQLVGASLLQTIDKHLL